MATPEARFNIKASDKTKSAFKSVNKGLKKMANTVLSVQTAVIGLAGAGGFGALAFASAKSTDSLAKKADQLGITTQALSGLHHATELYTSAGLGAMDEALVKARKRLGEFNATGGGAAAQWLKALNLDTKELAQLAPDQLFARYSDEINKMSDRGQQMAAISALMGDESRVLIPLIDAGSSAIRDATDEALAFGIALDRVDAAKVEAAMDSLTRTESVIKGVGTTVAVELSPYVAAAANSLADAAKNANGFKVEIVGAIESTLKGFGFVMDMFRGLEVVVKGVEVVIMGLVNIQLMWFDKLANGYIGLRQLFNEDYEPPGFIVAVKDAAGAASERFAQLKVELDTIAMQPMPSDNIAAWVDEVKLKAGEAAQAVAAVSHSQRQLTGSVLVENKKQEKSSKKKTKTLLQDVIGLTQGVAQHSKTMFEVNKIASIAQATVDGYASFNRTMSAYPFPVNVGLAGLSLAASLAQVSAIKSTSFSGGGGGTTPSAAGSVPTVNDTPVPQLANNQQQSGQQQDTIIIQGIDPDKLYSGQQLRDFADRLLESKASGASFV